MIVEHLLILCVLSLSFGSSQNLTLTTPNSSYVPNAITEWTAMGDSYASGIGAGSLPQDPDPDLCFRCSNAYPKIMQSGQGSLQPNPEKFNFVACSGAKFDEILAQQIWPHDRPGRPAWGESPEFVTITMGGNDIGILYLVLTCIYSIPIIGKGCDAVIQRGFDILDSRDFKNGLSEVIEEVRYRGREQYGRNFHIFVTGYARLFNSDTSQCDQVTFKPSAVLFPAQYLTQDRRRRMNDLAVALNRALQAAVEQFPTRFVTYVDYDDLFEGHRFCDRDEPNANDDETWFFQFGTTSDPTIEAFGFPEAHDSIGTKNVVSRLLLNRRLPDAAISTRHPGTRTPRQDSMKRPRDVNIRGPIPVAENGTGGDNAAFSNYWRVFHPKSQGHQAIRRAILAAIGRVQLSRSAGVTGGPHSTS